MIIPKKSLGQNFLVDKNIVKKIVNVTKINNENIIEIGPGLGALTDELIKLNPKKLIIIEKDNSIYKLLKKKYEKKNIIIVNQDIMHFNFNKLSNYKIISNLPYNISSKFLIKILKFNKQIDEVVCMIQSELANKFNYRIGKMNKYKFLSEYCSDFQIKFDVSKNVFHPKPKVKSSVVKILLKNQHINIPKIDEFIKLFFVNKRKIIKSNEKFKYLINNDKLHFRYEDLNYEDVLKIYQRF